MTRAAARPYARRGTAPPRWPILLSLALALGAFGGCSRDRDDGTDPTAAGDSLPPLVLTNETPELLLTWVDERGGTHTGVSLGEVPEGSKDLVRVTVKDAGHGALFYVADLRQKGADGSYPVRSMRRSDWEKAIADRRDAYRAQHAPPPTTPPATPPRPTPGEPPPDGRADPSSVNATIYGASWCKPCHDAAKYLNKKGVHVVEHDIEKQPRYASEMQDKLQRAGLRGGSIPVIDVAGTVMQGYNPRALDRAIQRAQAGGTRL
ncbi:MAG: glutaredoxin family protein [Myxococcales bacterium]|nr:glutaredoxin family protein [Myxococcales bacterium]